MGIIAGRVGGVGMIESRRHEAQDEVKGDGAEDSDAVDIAIEDLSGEEEEGAVEDDVEDGAVEVAVVHEVLVDLRKGVEDCEGLRAPSQFDDRIGRKRGSPSS